MTPPPNPRKVVEVERVVRALRRRRKACEDARDRMIQNGPDWSRHVVRTSGIIDGYTRAIETIRALTSQRRGKGKR